MSLFWKAIRMASLLLVVLLAPTQEARADYCGDFYSYIESHCVNVCTMGCSCVGESCTGWASACMDGPQIDCTW
jgi:hypothetical protein